MLHYYREYKDRPGFMEETLREDVVRALESRGYYAAGTVSDMEEEAKRGLVPFRSTDWARYSVKDTGCDHNEMVEIVGDPNHAWKCASCGYIYNKETK
jgi:hypothetical protein